MNEIHRFDLDDLSIEVEVITDQYDGRDIRDYYVRLTPRASFKVDDCKTDRDSHRAEVELSTTHLRTREEEWEEWGDMEGHRLRDEGRR